MQVMGDQFISDFRRWNSFSAIGTLREITLSSYLLFTHQVSLERYLLGFHVYGKFYENQPFRSQLNIGDLWSVDPHSVQDFNNVWFGAENK
jgi:hypothetical protein